MACALTDSKMKYCLSKICRWSEFIIMFKGLTYPQKLQLSIRIVERSRCEMCCTQVDNHNFEFIYVNVKDWFNVLSIDATGFLISKMSSMSESHLAEFISRTILWPKNLTNVYSKFTNIICQFLSARNVDTIDRVCRHMNVLIVSNIRKNRRAYGNFPDISDYIVHPVIGPIFRRHCAIAFIEILIVSNRRKYEFYEFDDRVIDFLIIIAKEGLPNSERSVLDKLFGVYRYSLIRAMLRKDKTIGLIKSADGTTIRKYALLPSVDALFRKMILESTSPHNTADLNYVLLHYQSGNAISIGNFFDLSDLSEITTPLDLYTRRVCSNLEILLAGRLQLYMNDRKFNYRFVFPFFSAGQIFNNSRFDEICGVVHTAHKIVNYRNPFFWVCKNSKQFICSDLHPLIRDFVGKPVDAVNAENFLQAAYSWCYENTPQSIAAFQIPEIDIETKKPLTDIHVAKKRLP